ncbi:MAG: hypothetical protein ACI8WB_003103 [Phenylobacterium sp.]|jgi:hypothetical protein
MMMKKNICLLAVLSALTAPVMADNVDWILNTDNTRDGDITGAADLILEGKIHSNHFNFVDPSAPELWQATGQIEATSATEIGSGTTPRINFVVSTPTETTQYLGSLTDTNQYQGSWFGPDGASGDFLLKPASTTPPPPTNDLLVSAVTASTEGYAGYGAAKTIDGILGSNTTNVWFSAHADATPSLTMDMGSSIQAYYYQLSRGYCNAQGWLFGTWLVKGSNDNSSWTTIDSELTDQADKYPTTSCNSFGEYYLIDTPGNYRYYKFEFTASSQSSSAGVSVGELKLWN